jgi:hypothetical protein
MATEIELFKISDITLVDVYLWGWMKSEVQSDRYSIYHSIKLEDISLFQGVLMWQILITVLSYNNNFNIILIQHYKSLF